MLKNRNIFSFSKVILYLLAFIVLWEWLRPLSVITDTGNLHVFILFSFFCLVIMYIRLVSFISVPLIFITIMYCLHSVFFDGPFWREGLATLIWFGEDTARNVSHIWGNDIHLLSYEFRSFLLLLVLAIVCYLIHFWLCHLKKIFFFLLASVIYITLLDTWTVYDGSSAIIRLVVAGFLLMTILYKMRLEEKEQVEVDEFKGRSWTNTLTVMIAFVAVISYFSPKYAPIWPDPVPIITGSAMGEGTGTTVRTIGYGQNDERLGGGFALDDTVVFRVNAKRGQYWRGESKEIYTGKGWVSIDHQLNKTFRYSENYDSKVAVRKFDWDVKKEEREATVTMVSDIRFWHFFYPGELIHIDENDVHFYSNIDEYQYLIDYVSGKVGTTNNDGKPLLLQEYTFTYNSPTFVIDQLKNAPADDPEHIREVYLQLPSMPERVGQLALEITEPYDNRYEKVKAIEAYFSKNGFEYETSDVAIPNDDQDYVDQFLFETQKGYCDNFSTSMIVMLRTLDIPARWVKGFTQGEVVDRQVDYNTYEISNTNAHSWVEVYFPTVGWVPFEPTKGFSHAFDFVQGIDLDTTVRDNNDPEGTIERPEQSQDPENPFLPYEEFDYGGGGDVVGGISKEEDELEAFQFPFKFVWFVLIISLVIFTIYKNHQRLITLVFLYAYKLRGNNPNRFVQAYERLLWLLQLNGFGRYGDETLREYASRIDASFSSSEMKELTLHYEKIYYGKNKGDHSWQDNKQLWETLVKKMTS